jgi:hypothetical protein
MLCYVAWKMTDISGELTASTVSQVAQSAVFGYGLDEDVQSPAKVKGFFL